MVLAGRLYSSRGKTGFAPKNAKPRCEAPNRTQRGDEGTYAPKPRTDQAMLQQCRAIRSLRTVAGGSIADIDRGDSVKDIVAHDGASVSLLERALQSVPAPTTTMYVLADQAAGN